MIPSRLQQVLEQSYIAMVNDAFFALTPSQRQTIYLSFGPLGDRFAHTARGWLSILTAQHVLPLWEQSYSFDDTPRQLLDLGKGVLRGTVETEEAEEETNRVLQKLETTHDGLESLNNHQEFYVLQAAISAVFDIVRDGSFWGTFLKGSNQHPIEKYTDADLDYWSSDTALWAITAFAGGLWNPTSNPLKRREFWKWWLKEAIPAAWELGSETEINLID